jgi:hypothetical protein
MRVPLRQIATLSGDQAVNTLNTFMKETHKALNWVEFGDGTTAENMGVVFISSTNSSGSADRELTLTHNLGHVPHGYIVIKQNAKGTLYDGSTANTATKLYLKWSETSAVTFKVMVF